MHLKSYIFHFNTPQFNLIFDWALKLVLVLRVRAFLGNGGPSRKGYKMRCVHHPFGFLHFFASLHACLHIHA